MYTPWQWIKNLNNEDEIDTMAVDFDVENETVLAIECYGILGMVDDSYMYSVKPYFHRYEKRHGYVIDAGGVVLKYETDTKDCFLPVNGQGKILIYKRTTGENWVFDREGFVYDNGNKITDEVNNILNTTTIWHKKDLASCWCYENQLVDYECPGCETLGHERATPKIVQNDFIISPTPMIKISDLS